MVQRMVSDIGGLTAYGEGPRMFFYGFKAVPEWAPPSENHILYSKSVLKNVSYSPGLVRYTPHRR